LGSKEAISSSRDQRLQQVRGDARRVSFAQALSMPCCGVLHRRVRQHAINGVGQLGFSIVTAFKYFSEDRNTLHWLEKTGTIPAVEISVDIVRQQ
jgi:hypothetical protein